MRRREFITLVGGVAVSWPLVARAQQSPLPIIGFLHPESVETRREQLAAFHAGLAETGYIEGRNVAIEYRWAEGQNDRLPELAADLVRRRVAVIAALSPPAAMAAKAATATIPIVFSIAGDPVQIGLVASLNRPGGNLTGETSLNVEVGPKQLELLHQLVPTATIIALLVNPTSPYIAEYTTKDVQAARTLGLQLHVLHASAERDFDAAFAALAQLRAGGLVISSDVLFNNRLDQLVALGARHAVPTIYQFREFVEAGGLISYGGSLRNGWHLVGVYSGRILKGDKPNDLPVQQAVKVELVINLKTAKALGLTVPQSLMVAADEVIE